MSFHLEKDSVRVSFEAAKKTFLKLNQSFVGFWGITFPMLLNICLTSAFLGSQDLKTGNNWDGFKLKYVIARELAKTSLD